MPASWLFSEELVNPFHIDGVLLGIVVRTGSMGCHFAAFALFRNRVNAAAAI